MTSRLHERFLDTSGLDVVGMEDYGRELTWWQARINWFIGDLALAAKAKLGEENYSQVFPPDVSPGLIQRCEAVALAYPREEDRNPLATWTIHMKHKNSPRRLALVAAAVEAGRTSDEERKHKEELSDQPNEHRWMLAFDIHYFIHRHYYSGAGAETAMQVADWVKRTIGRLKEKGATDAICAFEGRGSFRRELTEGDEWSEQRYKGNRGPKPDDLRQQLNLIRELLEGYGFCCVSSDGHEADDCIASAAKQFQGKTTIISADKDLKQCLSEKCNMLTDVTWIEDEHTADMIPEYRWYTAKSLKEETGLTPEQWICAQMLMGDPTDNIAGAQNIGEAGARNLVATFGSAANAIQAAKTDDERLLSMKRGKLMAKSLLEFEVKADTTRQLVKLKDDIPIPNTTRI